MSHRPGIEGASRPLARRLVGEVPVLELATDRALKDVHVARFFELADATRDEPHGMWNSPRGCTGGLDSALQGGWM